ncbi:MAG TPA: trehalose-phosphatase [Thermoleophilia bacterium]|nr:trehalose-phosphatase [Thermoleophilia bacterium]
MSPPESRGRGPAPGSPAAGSPAAGRLPAELHAALQRLAGLPGRSALFFDVDGVLASIRPRPEEAAVPRTVRRLLVDLVPAYRLVAAVSGRSLEEAVAMVDTPGVVVVGDHGRETRDEHGRVTRSRAAERGLIREAAAVLGGDAGLRRAGVRIEEKPASIALHVRGAADIARAETAALEAAAAVGRRFGLTVRQGRSVIDLKIPGVDKGTAVERLVARYGVESVLYVGDDTTDVDAMRALARMRSDVFFAVLLGVSSNEMPAELAAASDHLVRQREVASVLRALAPPRV